MENQDKIVGAVWTLAGLLMVASFLLPLYTGLFYEINGLELTDLLQNLDNDKLDSIDPFTGILMFVVPVVGLFLGFWSGIIGLLRLSGKRPVSRAWVQIACGANLVLGIFVVISLENQSSGFINAFLPKAATGFYLIMLGEILVGVPDLILKWTGNSGHKKSSSEEEL